MIHQELHELHTGILSDTYCHTLKEAILSGIIPFATFFQKCPATVIY